jgi:hypothetical protein
MFGLPFAPRCMPMLSGLAGVLSAPLFRRLGPFRVPGDSSLSAVAPGGFLPRFQWPHYISKRFAGKDSKAAFGLMP